MQEIAKYGFKVGEKIIVPMTDRRPWWKRLLRIKPPEPKWFRVAAVTDGSLRIADDD